MGFFFGFATSWLFEGLESLFEFVWIFGSRLRAHSAWLLRGNSVEFESYTLPTITGFSQLTLAKTPWRMSTQALYGTVEKNNAEKTNRANGETGIAQSHCACNMLWKGISA